MNYDLDPRRPAVRKSLEKRFGRAVPVTEAMIDSVLAELDAEGTDQS